MPMSLRLARYVPWPIQTDILFRPLFQSFPDFALRLRKNVNRLADSLTSCFDSLCFMKAKVLEGRARFCALSILISCSTLIWYLRPNRTFEGNLGLAPEGRGAATCGQRKVAQRGVTVYIDSG